jgi:hypothetical protein
LRADIRGGRVGTEEPLLLTGCDQLNHRVRQRREYPRIVRIFSLRRAAHANRVLLDGADERDRERLVTAAYPG